MSEEIRSIANELLVVTSEEEEAEKAAEKVRDLVDAILADPSLSHLGLYEPPTPSW